MGSTVGSNWPSGPAHKRLVFRDEDWSAVLGSSLWHQAPMLEATCDPSAYWNWRSQGTYLAADNTVTLNSGTIAQAAGDYGAVVVTSAAAATETTFQHLMQWKLHATKPIYFETEIAIDHAAEGAALAGLAIVDASPLASAPSSGIYFRKDNGDANLDCMVETGGASTDQDTGTDVVASTFVRCGFIATTSLVTFFVNGVAVKTSTTNIPASTVALRWTGSALGLSANATALTIREVRILQPR